MENNRSFYERGRVGAISSTADKSLSVWERLGGREAIFYKLGAKPFGRKIFNDRFVSRIFL